MIGKNVHPASCEGCLYDPFKLMFEAHEATGNTVALELVCPNGVRHLCKKKEEEMRK